jgi:hypothetical protein
MQNKKLIILLLLVLTSALLSGCGGPAQDNSVGSMNEELGIPEDVSAPPVADSTPETVSTPTPTPTPEPSPAAAVTDGELIYTLSPDDILLDANADAGWFTYGGMGKGYGTKYAAVNLSTGQEIEGEEGAEVVLCKNAIVQFIWRDADGNHVDAMDVYYYDGSSPKEINLWAVVYNFDGSIIDERVVLSMKQSADDPYYSTVYPVMEQVVSEYGGGYVAGYAKVLNANEDNGDAVISDERGELVRLPGADVTMTYASSVCDGRFVAVYRPDTNETEVYDFGA